MKEKGCKHSRLPFNDNFYSLWSTKLLEHIDYYLAPHLETVEQNIIKGTIAQAERMRNRNESPKAIESLEDLDPNCASLTRSYTKIINANT